MRLTIIVVVFVITLCAAEKPRAWETARVISQDLNTQQAGTYSGPLGNGTVAVPVYRRSNHVIVETDNYRFGWDEIGRTPLILPVNEQIRFYRDGKFFVVLDSENKKHKFVLSGAIKKEK
jgi:hypothetical protein